MKTHVASLILNAHTWKLQIIARLNDYIFKSKVHK